MQPEKSVFTSRLKEAWGSLFSSTPQPAGEEEDGKARYTPERLQQLYETLHRHPLVNDANKAIVVETVRSIAEFMIWGDQHEPGIFDFFLEHNIMVYLLSILQQPANCTGDVAKQVLQTLSIIIQNVRSETGIFFLFSNNHVNNIVASNFDFEDEEVLGYYISFLKAISLKLNPLTVRFFLLKAPASQHAPSGTPSTDTMLFPLYTEAVKFAHHKEGMVRAGVRTLTLNVYSVPDAGIQSFISSPASAKYFSDVAGYMAVQFEILNADMAAAEPFGQQALSQLDSQIAEVEDMLSYCNDVLNTAHPYTAHILAQALWQRLVGPYLLRPLLHASTENGPAPIKPQTCLYILERVFQLIMYAPLLNNILLALLAPPPSPHSLKTASIQPWAIAQDGSTPPSCRKALLALLSSHTPLATPAAVRLLVAVTQCRALSPGLLASIDLQPLPSPTHTTASHPPTDLCTQLTAERSHASASVATTQVLSAPQLGYAYYTCWSELTPPGQARAHEGVQGDGSNNKGGGEVSEEGGRLLVGSAAAHHEQQEAAEAEQQEAAEQQVQQEEQQEQQQREEQQEGLDLQQQQEAQSQLEQRGAPQQTQQEEQQHDEQQQQGTAPAAGSIDLLGLYSSSPVESPPASAQATPNAEGTGTAAQASGAFDDLLGLDSPGAGEQGATQGSDKLEDVALELPTAQDDGQGSEHTTPATTSVAAQSSSTETEQPSTQPAVRARVKPNMTVNTSGAELREAVRLPGVMGAMVDDLVEGVVNAHLGGSGSLQGSLHGSYSIDGTSPESTPQGAAVDKGSETGVGVMGETADSTAAIEAAADTETVDTAEATEQEGHNSLPAPPSPPAPPHPSPPPFTAYETLPSHTHPAHPAASDLVDALLSLLSAQHLPPYMLWHSAVLLRTWLGVHALPLSLQQPHLPKQQQAAPLPDLSDPGTSTHSASSPWVCTLDHTQRQTLTAAVTTAVAEVHTELDGMWCEAVFTLLCLEWQTAGQAISRPSLRAASDTIMTGPHLFLGSGPPAQAAVRQLGMGVSAAAALRTHLSVQRLVALLQLLCVMREGEPRMECPVPHMRDLKLRQLDVMEGQQIPMSQDNAIQCQVSFQPSQEKRVYFSVAGIALSSATELLQSVSVSSPSPCPSSPTPSATSTGTHEAAGSSTPTVAATESLPLTVEAASSTAALNVMHSSPAIVLGEASATRLHTGVVLSTAPLMGGAPYVDTNVPRWLHVHVRPSVRGLLRLMQEAQMRKGGLLYTLRSLADGHWVLAFQNGERCRDAHSRVVQQDGKLREVYKQLVGVFLAPLTADL